MYKLNARKLLKEDFNIPCKEMALSFLGKLLVRKLDENTILKGRIVETECYLGVEDKASHSYGGRITPKIEPMYMDPGTAYVYITYGIYCCFNISSKEPGSAVLLRALEPVEGIEATMEMRQLKKKGQNNTPIKIKELCNGPSKLCMSYDIYKENCNKLDLANNDLLWVEDDPNFTDEIKIVTSTRIGIASAGEEWANKPLRFYILNNEHVSKKDRKAEKELTFDNVNAFVRNITF